MGRLTENGTHSGRNSRIELRKEWETASRSLLCQTDSGDGSYKDKRSQPDKQPLEGVKEYSDNSGFRVAVIPA